MTEFNKTESGAPPPVKKRDYSRLVYGSLLLLSYAASNVLGAFWVIIYNTILLLLLMFELNSVIVEEVEKFLSGCIRAAKLEDGQSENTRLKSDIKQIVKKLRIQFLVLLFLTLYCRGSNMFTAGAKRDESNFLDRSYSSLHNQYFYSLLSLPSCLTNSSLYLLSFQFIHLKVFPMLNFLIKNNGVIAVFVYCVQLMWICKFFDSIARKYNEERGERGSVLACTLLGAACNHFIFLFVMAPQLCTMDMILDFGIFWGFLSVSSVVMNDIAAFVVGKLLGKHPLTVFSPKKTVEGYVGALVITVSYSLLLTYLSVNHLNNVIPMQLPLFLKGGSGGDGYYTTHFDSSKHAATSSSSAAALNHLYPHMATSDYLSNLLQHYHASLCVSPSSTYFINTPPALGTTLYSNISYHTHAYQPSLPYCIHTPRNPESVAFQSLPCLSETCPLVLNKDPNIYQVFINQPMEKVEKPDVSNNSKQKKADSHGKREDSRFFVELFSCIYVHALILALFASIVAPFGGFVSSGIKRGLNRKDYSQALGSHGGFADRFDCNGIMSLFAYSYLTAVYNITCVC